MMLKRTLAKMLVAIATVAGLSACGTNATITYNEILESEISLPDESPQEFEILSKTLLRSGMDIKVSSPEIGLLVTEPLKIESGKRGGKYSPPFDTYLQLRCQLDSDENMLLIIPSVRSVNRLNPEAFTEFRPRQIADIEIEKESSTFNENHRRLAEIREDVKRTMQAYERFLKALADAFEVPHSNIQYYARSAKTTATIFLTQ